MILAILALIAAAAQAQEPGQFVINTCDYSPEESFEIPPQNGPAAHIVLASAVGTCVGLVDSASGVAAVPQPCAAAPLYEFVDKHFLVNTTAHAGLCLGADFSSPPSLGAPQ